MARRCELALATLLAASVASSCGGGLPRKHVEAGPRPFTSFWLNTQPIEGNGPVYITLGEVVTASPGWAGKCYVENRMDIGGAWEYVPCYEKDFSVAVRCLGVRCLIDGKRAEAFRRAKGNLDVEIAATETGILRIEAKLRHGEQEFTAVSPPFVVRRSSSLPVDRGVPARREPEVRDGGPASLEGAGLDGGASRSTKPLF